MLSLPVSSLPKPYFSCNNPSKNKNGCVLVASSSYCNRGDKLSGLVNLLGLSLSKYFFTSCYRITLISRVLIPLWDLSRECSLPFRSILAICSLSYVNTSCLLIRGPMLFSLLFWSKAGKELFWIGLCYDTVQYRGCSVHMPSLNSAEYFLVQ